MISESGLRNIIEGQRQRWSRDPRYHGAYAKDMLPWRKRLRSILDYRGGPEAVRAEVKRLREGQR